jgi:hypothetical protein
MSRTNKARKSALALVTEIDEAELGVRLMEVAIGMKRPASETRPAAMILHDAKVGLPDDSMFAFDKMARVAINYFGECIKKAQPPQ